MSVAGPLYGPTTGLCQAVYQVSFFDAKKLLMAVFAKNLGNTKVSLRHSLDKTIQFTSISTFIII